MVFEVVVEMNQDFLLHLVLLLIVAKTIEKVFSYRSINPLVAHVVAGIVLSSYTFGIISPSEALRAVSYLGLLLLMLYTGVTTNFSEVKRVSPWIVAISVSGVATTIVLSFMALVALGYNPVKALLISILMSNTATEVAAAIVSKEVDSVVRSIVVGASVVDDILAVMVLGVITSVFIGTNGYNIAYSIVASIVFLSLTLMLSNMLVKHPRVFYQRIATDRVTFASTTIITACLFALIARLIGLNELIGVYLAGLIISRGRECPDPLLLTNTAIVGFIDQLKIFLESLALPLFFTYVGLTAVPQQINLPLYACLLTIAMISKVVGCGLPSYIAVRDRRSALSIGIAMTGRGALETALLKLLHDIEMIGLDEYTSLLLTSISTTILAPILYNIISTSTYTYSRRPITITKT